MDDLHVSNTSGPEIAVVKGSNTREKNAYHVYKQYRIATSILPREVCPLGARRMARTYSWTYLKRKFHWRGKVYRVDMFQ